MSHAALDNAHSARRVSSYTPLRRHPQLPHGAAPALPHPPSHSRKSVQFANAGYSARPLPYAPPPNAYTQQAMRHRSPPSSEDELMATPPLGRQTLGLSMAFDSDSSSTRSSVSSELQTPLSSSPTTPTRLLFVCESFDTLSHPSTLDELARLKAAAKELDLESKRLRRNKGRTISQPRLLPRKAVPAVTEIELATPPKPRRPAVRHSLVLPSTHEFSLMPAAVDLADSPEPDFSPVFAPVQVPAARRAAFYSQGKAAMSVIEFGSKTEASPDARAESVGRGFMTLATLKKEAAARREERERPEREAAVERELEAREQQRAEAREVQRAEAQRETLQRERAEFHRAQQQQQQQQHRYPAPTRASPTAPGPPVLSAPLPIPALSLEHALYAQSYAPSPRSPRSPRNASFAAAQAAPPLPPIPTPAAEPSRSLSGKASYGFLGKKKFGRFLGKSAA